MIKNKKTTMMKVVLRYVNIPKATVFEQVKAEKSFSEDIKIINAIRNVQMAERESGDQ